MKKIWVVDEGGYDTSPKGYFSRKDWAIKAARFLGMREDDVKEIELDPLVKEVAREYNKYYVIMLRDGAVERIDRQQTYYDLDTNRCFIWDRPNAPAYRGKGIPDALNANVWVRTEKHAIKIADKMRLEKIESGEWK